MQRDFVETELPYPYTELQLLGVSNDDISRAIGLSLNSYKRKRIST